MLWKTFLNYLHCDLLGFQMYYVIHSTHFSLYLLAISSDRALFTLFSRAALLFSIYYVIGLVCLHLLLIYEMHSWILIFREINLQKKIRNNWRIFPWNWFAKHYLLFAGELISTQKTTKVALLWGWPDDMTNQKSRPCC